MLSYLTGETTWGLKLPIPPIVRIECALVINLEEISNGTKKGLAFGRPETANFEEPSISSILLEEPKVTILRSGQEVNAYMNLLIRKYFLNFRVRKYFFVIFLNWGRNNINAPPNIRIYFLRSTPWSGSALNPYRKPCWKMKTNIPPFWCRSMD